MLAEWQIVYRPHYLILSRWYIFSYHLKFTKARFDQYLDDQIEYVDFLQT